MRASHYESKRRHVTKHVTLPHLCLVQLVCGTLLYCVHISQTDNVVIDDWIHGDNTHIQNVFNLLFLYKIVVRIYYKEYQFAIKPRQLRRTRDHG